MYVSAFVGELIMSKRKLMGPDFLRRLLLIHEEIDSHNGVSKAYLAEKLEVSEKTIQRDITFMREEFNAPIEFQRGKGYFYNSKFVFPFFELADDEITGFYLIKALLKQYQSAPFQGALDKSFDKIHKLVSRSIDLDKNISIIPFPPSSINNERVFDNILNAIKEKKVLEVRYSALYRSHDKDSKCSKRRLLSPYHLVQWNGAWYLIAYCHTNKDIRVFNLSRFSYAVSSDTRKFINVGIDKVNAENIVANIFGIYWEEPQISVKLRFHSEVAHFIREKNWGKFAKWEEDQRDGSIIFTIKVRDIEEIRPWILSWGYNVTVLKPDKLKKKIMYYMNETLNMYKVEEAKKEAACRLGV